MELEKIIGYVCIGVLVAVFIYIWRITVKLQKDIDSILKRSDAHKEMCKDKAEMSKENTTEKNSTNAT